VKNRMSITERLDDMENKIGDIHKEFTAPKRTMMDIVLGKNKPEKTFKLPAKIRAGRKKKLKKNYALIVYMMNNGYLDFWLAPIENDMVYMKASGKYHSATADYSFRHKEYPVYVIPEWSLEPISTKEHLDMVRKDGLETNSQKVLINMMELASLKELAGKKGFGGKTTVWIMVFVIIGLYLLLKAFGMM